MKTRICFFVLSIIMVFTVTARAENEAFDGVDAKSYILVEQSTGRVLAESNPDEQLPIASVTKIMTMLLIMEAVDEGVITINDMVTVSENAMSYGGSTMFLETGEQLSVNDMLKGIAVASANDGCVAMAEHLAGSESGFVEKMNTRAKELGMENTHFMNTNGLDEDNHYSSARDVAIMSRELLKHPKITDYTSIWTDELRGGKFQLANTNKLIRFYTGANGLKTGSTSQALCCLSASAVRNDMQLIAVVLGAPTSDKRFSSARALLDYGFASYKINNLATENDYVCDVEIENGTEKSVRGIVKESKSHLSEKNNAGKIEQRVYVDDGIKAPLEKGSRVGSIEFVCNGQKIDDVEIVSEYAVDKKGIGKIMKDLILGFM